MNNNKLKQIDLKNRTCYRFDDINIIDLDLYNILIDKVSYEIILNYDAAYKTTYGKKPLQIIFHKVEKYIKKDGGTISPAIFYANEKYSRNFDRIKCLIILKSNISDVYSHIYAKIKINAVMIYLCSNPDHYYCKVFSEECTYK